MAVDLAPLAAFAVICLAVFLFGQALLPSSRAKRSRLVFGPLTGFLAAFIPQFSAAADRLSLDLKRAGYYKPKAREEFLAIRNVVLLLWASLIAMTVFKGPVASPEVRVHLLLGGVLGTILIYAVPRLSIQWEGDRRVRRIQLGLPDALDVTTMCLTGGRPLHDALDRVSREIQSTHPDLAYELEIVWRQTDTGTLEQALDEFARRIDVPDVRALTALVGQTERLGANVAGALRDFADSIRRTHRQRAEERGNKATVKMLFPIAFCLAPPIYILLLGPALLELRDFVVKENRPGGVLARVDPNRPLRALVPGDDSSVSPATQARDEVNRLRNERTRRVRSERAARLEQASPRSNAAPFGDD